MTRHPASVRAGLAGTLDWVGLSVMTRAVEPIAPCAVSDGDFRIQKELLRTRLYSAAQRAMRDQVLAEIADRMGKFC